MTRGAFVHPYMPNSVPAVREAMLKELGVSSVEEIYKSVIPDRLLFKGRLDLPERIESEAELVDHVMGLLRKNVSCDDVINFLGAGCYRHYVPALCDEIAGRAEFLTAYCGDTYSDHGKMQAIFEYASMMGELLDADVVSYTTYDGGQAVCSSLRMMMRMTGRRQVLVPETMNPEILSQARTYCCSAGEVVTVKADGNTGRMDLDDLKSKLGGQAAGVFFENPSYLGFLEEEPRHIVSLAHDVGALCVVMPEVASLGVLESPVNYGADFVCGEIQPLGMHLQLGGGCGGFIAGPQESRFIEELPTYLYGLAPTDDPHSFGWGRALLSRCSHGSREKAREYFGTESGLWAIVAGVYLASMGPQGMRELGETIMQRTAYAIQKLSALPRLRVHPFGGAVFQEFVVNFDAAGLTVAQVNKELLKRKIFGGKDLSRDFPQYGQSALYAVTERVTADQIDVLAAALKEILGGVRS
ncbi:MAG: aminomethyl-transferring glycine dehydrogenase subunit GcvPA [Pyramidobacter sp.]